MSLDLVYFDFDVINLCVGDFVDNDLDIIYMMVFIIKFVDFGMIIFMRNVMWNDFKLMYIFWLRGKYWLGWLLLEQFIEEWDYIMGFLFVEEIDLEKKFSIVGKYLYKINFYYVGLVMWGLIIFCKLFFFLVLYECFEKEVIDLDIGNFVLDFKIG